MGYGPKPPAEAPAPGEERRRSIRRNQVLSRKAVERSRILQKSSRSMIDASKALVSQSSNKKAKPANRKAKCSGAARNGIR